MNTAHGPILRQDRSYMVERVVQSESSREQIVYLTSKKREGGPLALNNQTTAGMWVLQVIPLYH